MFQRMPGLDRYIDRGDLFQKLRGQLDQEWSSSEEMSLGERPEESWPELSSELSSELISSLLLHSLSGSPCSFQ